MKRYAVLLISLFAALAASAQGYEPTTTWPYLYPDFTEGELQTFGGKKTDGLFNVHLAGGRLHFIEDGFIMEASSSEVFSVRIGGDIFTNVGGKLMKVLAKSDRSIVAEETKVNLSEMNETGGAYGSSSNTTSTQAFSSFEGIGGTRSNMNHMEIRSSKDEGKILSLDSKLYMIVHGKTILASKKDFADASRCAPDSAKVFLKENKIKWKEPQSVLAAADFLADILGE